MIKVTNGSEINISIIFLLKFFLHENAKWVTVRILKSNEQGLQKFLQKRQDVDPQMPILKPEVFQLLSERKLSYGTHQNNAFEAKNTAITKI